VNTLEHRILIVDDDESIRNAFSKILTRHDYRVRTAGTAEEALVLMNEEPAWVLFMDLNLPGMDGVELCRRVRSHWPMAVAYAVTGYASLFELTGCRSAGFEDYFTKPVLIEDLLTAAERAFEKLERWKSTSAARSA
jgi:DNA-binding NtrC family response regulator